MDFKFKKEFKKKSELLDFGKILEKITKLAEKKLKVNDPSELKDARLEENEGKLEEDDE